MQIDYLQGSRILMQGSPGRALTSHREPEHTLEKGGMLEDDAALKCRIQGNQAPRFMAECRSSGDHLVGVGD